MASEAELKVVFDIFKHDQQLALEATRALAWAATRTGVVLTAAEEELFSFALLANDSSSTADSTAFLDLQCASKGCGGSSFGGP